MSNKETKDPKGENTSAGDHLGGTKFGQAPEATTKNADNANRPRDGGEQKK
jgi:hypothetical protein